METRTGVLTFERGVLLTDEVLDEVEAEELVREGVEREGVGVMREREGVDILAEEVGEEGKEGRAEGREKERSVMVEERKARRFRSREKNASALGATFRS